jgi:hypothetical protein
MPPVETPSSVIVEQQPIVDIGRTEGEQPGGEGEETMEQYAARREAEIRGEKPAEPKPREAEPAAATDKPAAATDEPKPGEEDPSNLIEEKHPAKKGVSKRFSELTEQRKTAEAAAAKAKEEAAAAKAETERLTRELEEQRAKAPVVPDEAQDPAPGREDYDDPDAYQEALTAHAARKEIRKANEAAAAKEAERQKEKTAKDEQARKAQIEATITQMHKTFNERCEAGAKEYPDYAARVSENEQLSIRNDIFYSIEKAELAPHILYHLATHDQDRTELNQMDPVDALLRLGELQAEIRTARKAKPSRAAPIITPIRQRASPDRKTPDEETMEEYAARREREESDKRAARRRAH